VIKLKFAQQTEKVQVKKKDEPVNPMVKSIRIRPDLEARYEKGVADGLAKMCAECTCYMKNICKTPKKKAEVQPGQRPCREYDLDGRLCGVTETEIQQAAVKENAQAKVKHKPKPEASGKKSQWQITLDKNFAAKKVPNPDFMNAKRWKYWEALKVAAGVDVHSGQSVADAAKTKIKVAVKRKG
jgi:hypothetical protein